eukprot:CAMPEP_0205910122 /NCGR_PEP_ID=MMETSP1325-20131115/4260_1 /ASSEMBLY_ACC=CAM_ASM_000708 /TAXON_ID=236786 /ORGANISM="Florenciella sp., Strain RCC1007" /LENGTH=340 /DNA_ID=CAMNT_0053276453 /DNA_START=78 /DNA_END=1098 /DNA_ORIENTATION=+
MPSHHALRGMGRSYTVPVRAVATPSPLQGQLDRVQVIRVGRKPQDPGAHGLDKLDHLIAVVNRCVIKNEDAVLAGVRVHVRDDMVLKVKEEKLSVHAVDVVDRAIDHALERHHAQRTIAPCAARPVDLDLDPRASELPPVPTRQRLRILPCLIDEDEHLDCLRAQRLEKQITLIIAPVRVDTRQHTPAEPHPDEGHADRCPLILHAKFVFQPDHHLVQEEGRINLVQVHQQLVKVVHFHLSRPSAPSAAWGIESARPGILQDPVINGTAGWANATMLGLVLTGKSTRRVLVVKDELHHLTAQHFTVRHEPRPLSSSSAWSSPPRLGSSSSSAAQIKDETT